MSVKIFKSSHKTSQSSYGRGEATIKNVWNVTYMEEDR